AMGFDALLEFVAPVVAAQEADAFVRQLAAIEARDRRPFLKDIAAPTLVVHGAEDVTALPGAARELADGIPNARLYLMEGAGHGTRFEQPDAFNAAVREFIGSVA